jgi:hypothetical protein
VENDAQLARLRSLLEEYETLVGKHGSLSAPQVIRREELAELLCFYTGRADRKRAVREAAKILQDPSLYDAKKIRERRRSLLAKRRAALRRRVAEISRAGRSRAKFDADRVRSILPSATETSRRRH